ncbi:peptidyl-dipeptidase Dcp [Sphingomonas jejuensis]|uniref:Peptidyl-dipeptidase Dcp n=1 Tax=Sphingomonas jejuensis TaxID=904715 RepID=A0ABX0XJC5_9SPHN|nr:M3 family metallopeptidase [Sphingomonas jejuensis]NJC32977.1 peptidyl-dipeptidase Dcp [Sphingomonas jejuensis]
MASAQTTASATPAPARTQPAAAAAAPATGDNPIGPMWTGPFEGVPPWDKMRPAQFPAAFQAAIDELRTEMAAIRDNRAPATFANVNEAMQLAGGRADRVFAMWGVQTSNLSNPEVQAIEREWSPRLAAAFDEITLDPALFARVKAVYDGRQSAGLNPQQLRIVERDYRRMVREGAALQGEQKARLTAINQELATLFADFSAKVLADEEKAIVVEDEAQLAGIPDSLKASYAAAAAEMGQGGKWAIKNTRSSVDPLLTFATDRALRQRVWTAFVNRGDNGDANDTNQVIANILRLRAERARLLGFATHANYRMDDTMAQDPARAEALMMRVWPAAVARVREEVAAQQEIARADGQAITIEPWDYRFYQEKVRKARFDLDQQQLKPYFELNNMVNALFWAAGQLYDLEFTENTGAVPVFHPDVRTFAVTNKRTGENVGLFYLDNFARNGKRSGAWMTTYRSQQGLGGERNVLSSNNNNFTKGAGGQPTLISLDDAETLFHEFGHNIHYLLQDVYYPALGGVPRDFVEFPSQVNENWLMTPEILDRFARHYQTNEPLPAELRQRILDSQTFNQGFATVEYLSSAIVDMRLHNRAEPVTDVDAFERETLAELGMPREIVMRHRLPQFNHLFSSDSYSAGYYSYLWSETMDADTWAAFEEAGGPWDRTVADRFRTILLSTGNETDRAEAYRQFRGRDPDVSALLKKRGFPTN